MTKKGDAANFYSDPANSLGYLSRIAFRSFSRAMEKRTLPYGVTGGQWRFLRVLWKEDGLTQRELSRRIGMREPTTVMALKSLERSGFVRREKSTDDKRRIHVFLTPEAKKLDSKLRPFVAEVNDIATRGMTDEQVASLRQLLAKICENLAGEIGNDSLKSGDA